MNHSLSDDDELSESHDEAEDDTDSGSTSSASSASSSASSSSVSNENELELELELAKITANEVLQLPRGLCENPAIFREFFSLDTWQLLSEEQRAQLQHFLPSFSHLVEPDEVAYEQDRTVNMFFGGGLDRFGHTPLGDLQHNLEEGNYRPDVQDLHKTIAKSRRREQRFQDCERLSQLAKQLFIARENLLQSAYKSAPDTVLRTERNLRRQQTTLLYGDTKLSAVRARKRFYKEVSQISQMVGGGATKPDGLSADENDPDSLTAEEMRHDSQLQQYIADEINTMKSGLTSTSATTEKCVYGTLFKRRHDLTDEEALRAEQCTKQTRLSNRNLRQCMLEHKRRKLMEPSQPEFETSDIRLRDVCARAQIGGNFKRMFGTGKQPGRKPKQPKISEPPALVPIQQHRMSVESEAPPLHVFDTVPSSKVTESLTDSNTQPESQFSLTGHAADFTENSYIPGESEPFGGILDNDVELQQVEVETYGTCEESLPAFLISNEIELPQSEQLPEKVFQTPQKERKPALYLEESAAASLPTNQHNYRQSLSMDNLPKLEPILTPQKERSLHQFKTNSPTATNTPVNGGAVQTKKTSATPPSKTKLGRSASIELLQDTHESFFSLMRDFFCSTPQHRLPYDDLKVKVDQWLCNPITALNDWYAQADSWPAQLMSAMQFLAGECADTPEDYVPYLEYKTNLNIYQWIGAGRDSDAHLTPLFRYWLHQRHEVPQEPSGHEDFQSEQMPDLHHYTCEVEESHTSDGGVTPPPPPRCPTKWTVRAATTEEVLEFQRQERERFEQPHRAYTYRMHGYESVVGPVKGIYTQILALTKAREHSMMIGDRPNFVTILTLVRDATARLPNGEGTRADISELLKCSQYINRDAAETVLQTIVSGALDRMHTEHDPCVRYDPKRKIWIYLHRNRTEEEFERMHQQSQGLGKVKKLPNRKPKMKGPAPTKGSSTAGIDFDLDTIKVAPSPNAFNMTLPALVPAQSATVHSQSGQSPQQQQQQQKPTLPKYPPVPPLKYNIPSQQKSLLKTTYSAQRAVHAQDNKTTTATNGGTGKQLNSVQQPKAFSNAAGNTMPVVVATPSGLHTVHVSNAASVVPPASGLDTMTVQHLSPQQQQPAPALSATVGGKRVALNKPIIISQITQQVATKSKAATQAAAKQQFQQAQVHQPQSILIPIGEQQNFSAVDGSIDAITSNEPSNIQTIFLDSAHFAPVDQAATSTPTQQDGQPSPTMKNIIRLMPTVSSSNSGGGVGGVGVRSLITTTPIMTTLQQGVRQQQHVVAQRINTIGSVPAQHQQQYHHPQHQQQQNEQPKATTLGGISILSGGNVVSSGNVIQGSAAGGTIVKMTPQAFASLQQKHGQHIFVKQASSAASSVGHQQQQRVIVSSAALITPPAPSSKVTTVSGISNAAGSTELASAIFNISAQSSQSATAATTNKIQTIKASNLTPQQQHMLVQNLKQQQQLQQLQFKTLQVVNNSRQQPQQQHQQQQSDATPQLMTRTVIPQGAVVGTQNAKPVTVVVSQSQSQAITRLVKAGLTTTSTTGTAVHQQQQQMASGTSQLPTTNLIQLQGPNSSQFAVVSQPRSIISLGSAPQRLITTQAGNSTILTTTTMTTPVTVTNMHAKETAQSTGQGAQQLNATKVLTKGNVLMAQPGSMLANVGGNLRFINTGAVGMNASSTTFNIANIQGKQVLFATKAANAGTTGAVKNVVNVSASQVQQLQNAGLIIGGQTLKLQSNANIIQKVGTAKGASANIIGAQATTQQPLQTVILGNQVLRVQQMPQVLKNAGTAGRQAVVVSSAPPLKTVVNTSSPNSVVVNNNEAILSGNNSGAVHKTILVGAGGQTLRLQPSSTSQDQITGLKGVTPANANRVVLAVQGGGQVFLSPNFQGSGINLKALQNMKVVSMPTAVSASNVQQQQQQQQQQPQMNSPAIITQQSILKSATASRTGTADGSDGS